MTCDLWGMVIILDKCSELYKTPSTELQLTANFVITPESLVILLCIMLYSDSTQRQSDLLLISWVYGLLSKNNMQLRNI